MSKTTRSNKEIQEIINAIRKLPLSQLKVLTFLSFRGPSWPKQINDEIGVPDGTIRPALRQLRSKGYLTQELNGIYRSNIHFTDIIISEIIQTHEEFESRVLASVSKIIHKHEEKFKSRMISSDSKTIRKQKEFESRVLASVSKIIHKHEEKFKSRMISSDPIIISVPEKSIITIKNLKDAGYPPREINRIMKAKGKNVHVNAIRDLLIEPVFPEDFFDVKEALE